LQVRTDAIELEVKGWAACAPGLASHADWSAWADGNKQISGPISADVRFVERLLRRRLTPLNRMVFQVAAECLNGREDTPSVVFCSRYGEFLRAFEMFQNLAKEEPISPMTFSLSVHNTAISLLSIMQRDNAHATALAGGDATLETGFVESWTLLKERAASSVLLIYGDHVLPEMFSGQETNVHHNVALAFLFQLPEETKKNTALGLSWQRAREGVSGAKNNSDRSPLRVLKLLLKGGDPIVSQFGRMMWVWKCDGVPA